MLPSLRTLLRPSDSVSRQTTDLAIAVHRLYQNRMPELFPDITVFYFFFSYFIMHSGLLTACIASLLAILSTSSSHEDMSSAGRGVVLRAVPTSQHMPSQYQPYLP